MVDSQRKDGLVLLAEDDPSQAQILGRWLTSSGYEARTFRDGESLIDAFPELLPDVICLDLGMPGMGGLSTLSHVREHYPLIPVLIITAESDVESVVAAMKAGAHDYLTKPVDKTRFLTQIQNALEKSRMTLRLAQLEREVSGEGYPGIVGRSPAMKDLFLQLDRVAPSDVTVLIHGESGTGKELVARAIHGKSAWKGGAFVALNCAAIPENLQESELFGHEKGAFTGADSKRIGRFEEADGGTLFLDEIGELSASSQAKLLRVLQEHTFRRVGGSRDLRSKFRLLAATHRNLEEDVRQGRFREDLYYRIAVFELELPPLRERDGDITLLAEAFTHEESGGQTLSLHPSTVESLMRYSWPGNVRELRNAIQRAALLAQDGVIRSVDLPPRIQRALDVGETDARNAPPTVEPSEEREATEPEPASLEDMERKAIEAALERHGGNVSEVARQLGIGRTTLYRRLRKWGLV